MKAILLMCALASFCAGRAAAQDNLQAAITLAERLADAAGQGATVTVAAAPAGWTSPAPLPVSGTLLGSVANASGQVTLYYQIPNLTAAYEAYVAALKRNGFTAQRFEGPVRGFAPPESVGVPVTSSFCKASTTVYMLAPPTRPGDLRISIFPQQPDTTPMCGGRPLPTQRVNPLPFFEAPPGTYFEPLTNSFSAPQYSVTAPATLMSSATVRGASSLEDIFTSLQSQLRAANWVVSHTIVQPGSASAQLAFGTGSEMWHGLLTLYPGQPNTFVAQINAAGGSLTPGQSALLEPHQMPHVTPALQKSNEPALIHLMRRMFSMEADMPQSIYIGRAPPQLAKTLPLPSRAPLGSAVVRIRDPMVANAEATLYYSLTEKELRSYYERLRKSGWSVLASPMEKASGFYGPSEGAIVSFVKPGLPIIMIQMMPTPNDVDISILRGGAAIQQALGQFAEQFGPMPPIVPPTGVTMKAGAPGIPGGMSGAEFRGASSLSQLLDSFSAQFAKAGWKAGAASASAQIGSRTFTINAKRRRWQAVVTVYASASEPHTYYSFIDLTNVP